MRLPGTRKLLVAACVSAVTFLLAGGTVEAGDRESIVRDLAAGREKFKSANEWQARRTEIREGFLKGADLWPLPERTPLNPALHSRREHDGYSVENVTIESIPGFFVTGNLYRPLQNRQGPGVLCPHGHFRDGGRLRPDHQVRCAHLARMGTTVF